MKENSSVFGGFASIFEFVLTALQTDEVLRYVNLGLAIITSVVSIAWIVWRWYKQAKADGKITKEEVEDLIDQVGGEIEKVNKKADNNKKED